MRLIGTIFGIIFLAIIWLLCIIVGAVSIDDTIRAYKQKKWLRFGLSGMLSIASILGLVDLYFF